MLNISYLFSSKNKNICPSKNDVFSILKGKIIVYSKEYKENGFTNKSSSSNSFWSVMKIKELKEENFPLYSSNFINFVPSYAEKACFRDLLCAFWLKEETYTDLYLIYSPPEMMTVLLSPKLMSILKESKKE